MSLKKRMKDYASFVRHLSRRVPSDIFVCKLLGEAGDNILILFGDFCDWFRELVAIEGWTRDCMFLPNNPIFYYTVRAGFVVL